MSFKTKKFKRKKLIFDQCNNLQTLINKKEEKQFAKEPSKVIKGAKVLYESDWVIAQKPERGDDEYIDSAVTQHKGTLLPERHLYDFSVNLNIPEKFIPYLKMQVLTKSAPETMIQGVFPYVSSTMREMQFQLYDWKGITYTSATLTPQPVCCYAYTPAGWHPTLPSSAYWTFKYPSLNNPIPIGIDLSYVLQCAEQYIGYENRLIYTPNPEWDSYWHYGEICNFDRLIYIYRHHMTLDELKDEVLNKYFDNIIYSDPSEDAKRDNFKGSVATKEELPLTGNTDGDYYVVFDFYYIWNKEESDGTIDNWVRLYSVFLEKAYENVYTNQVATSNQVKQVDRISQFKANLHVYGDVLLISPANTPWLWGTDSIFPNYVATTGGDVEVKLRVTITNPSYFTETKGYN